MDDDKYLITGFSGFVSYYFCKFLNKQAETHGAVTKVLGLDVMVCEEIEKYKSEFTCLDICFETINLLDYTSLEKVLLDFHPSKILHLASFSSVSASWKKPSECFINNTNIFLNLVEVIRKNNIKAKILSVGSSEEYGVVNDFTELEENRIVEPSNPYAIARYSQELLSKCYSKAYGMDIVLTRSFNHIGPRQRDVFVIPHFVKEVAKGIITKSKTIVLETGDTSIVRDFLDVRDVVEAYYLLLQYGQAGEIYNVCSGIGNSLDNILSKIEKLSDVKIHKVLCAEYIRPIDNPVIIGCNKKITKITNWTPRYNIEQSLKDMICYWVDVMSDK